MTIRMGVTGTAKFRRTARRLQEAKPIITTEAGREIVRASPPVLGAVQAQVRGASFPAVPSKGGGGHTGLREHLATSTRSRPYGAGVKFVVADPRGQKMARLTEGTTGATRWRHPVFGNRDAWVQQRADPWFFPTIRSKRPVFAGAVERAVRNIVRRLGG